MSSLPILLVAGVGNGAGTGAATARLFAKNGYRVALIARSSGDGPQRLAKEITDAGGEAAPFPIPAYTYKDVTEVFERVQKHWPTGELRVALYNVSFACFKGFLDVTEDDVDAGTDANLKAAYAFSRQAVLQMKGQSIDDKGKRGTILYTGATASIRGNVMTSGFAPGKSGLRMLAQSLSKEFGKDNIHVAHTVIDGGILTDKSHTYRSEEWCNNPDAHIKPDGIAASYLYLAQQDRSAWSFELDLRPAHEKW
jgi:NAD(P)-dependent dehydrogenase (short-subunit alcohol dehydrogenase family)